MIRIEFSYRLGRVRVGLRGTWTRDSRTWRRRPCRWSWGRPWAWLHLWSSRPTCLEMCKVKDRDPCTLPLTADLICKGLGLSGAWNLSVVAGPRISLRWMRTWKRQSRRREAGGLPRRRLPVTRGAPHAWIILPNNSFLIINYGR